MVSVCRRSAPISSPPYDSGPDLAGRLAVVLRTFRAAYYGRRMNESAIIMWNDFLGATGTASRTDPIGLPGAWAFGLGEAMETERAELVVAGIKRATVTSVESLRYAGSIRRTGKSVH